jgi:uncharacterized RDD family membrane protein YckC
MLIVRRIIAFIIDFIIYLILILPGGAYFDELMMRILNLSSTEEFNRQYWIKYVLFISIIYWVFIEVIFKQSFGKWIFRLHFVNYSRFNLSYAILYRNLLKAFIISSGLGILINLIYYLVTKKSGYDKIIGTDVTIKDYGLTDIQKNWRKHFNK